MTRKQLWCWLLIAPAVARAASPVAPVEPQRALDFSLYFGRATAPFTYRDGRTYDTTSRSIGVAWRERIGPRLLLGAHGGYAHVSQTGNPATAGLELDGYHAGISLDGIFAESRRAVLYYVLDYTYQKADDKNDSGTVTLEWSEARALLGASVALGHRVRLYGGGGYGYLDGEERASGMNTHTTDFSRPGRALGLLGLDLSVDAEGGSVGIEAGSGLGRHAQIYFKRSY
jgi:opacity protein-like surface antigen